MSVVIDGTRFPVDIVDLEMTSDVIDKYAERVESGSLQHEVLGVFYNYKVEFDAIQDPALFESFYSMLTKPKNSWVVTLPGLYTTYTFNCYIRVEGVKIRRHRASGNVYEGLKVSFIAIDPARRP